MENLDQIFKEWKEALDEPITKSFKLTNLTNNSIMNTFMNYENKVNASKSNSIKVLCSVALIFVTALVIFSLLSYFRGSQNVTYDIPEMVIGTFLSVFAIGAMIRNIMKIKFPDISSNPTLEYLTSLKQNLIDWRTRERPALLIFVLLVPTGVALLVKSVFLIPFYYIFIPFFLLYLSVVIFTFVKNNPEFNAVLEEIDELLLDLKSSS